MASGDKNDHSFLSEDIILLILSRLPFKSLYRLKVVSKRWLALIANHILPQALSCRLIGFYLHINGIKEKRGLYRGILRSRFQQMAHDGDRMEEIPDGMVDTALSFLPVCPRDHDITVLDCCNGLVLCVDRCRPNFYVCNPAIRSCDSLSAPHGCTWAPSYCKLAFDPLVSRHLYKLVCLGTDREGGTEDLRILTCSSSDSGVWKKKMLRRSMGLCLVRSSTFCNGALFVACSNFIIGYVVRIDLLTDDCQLIELPSNEVGRAITYAAIGKLRGKACHADFDGEHRLLRIWVLGEDQDDEAAAWTMVHERTILAYDNEHQVLAFHPFEEVIYFLMMSRTFAYDLNRMSWEEVCLLETEEYGVTRLTALPFFLVL